MTKPHRFNPHQAANQGFPASARALILLGVLAAGGWAMGGAMAADPVPEVSRSEYPAQPVGQAHTIRIIPEACVYLQGEFTGVADAPYRWFSARNGRRCQPRAGFVSGERAKPSVAKGWKLNDVIKVPDAACVGRKAVIWVWRRPVETPAPLDARGQARIYLDEAKRRAETGKLPPITVYAATMTLEGEKACG